MKLNGHYRDLQDSYLFSTIAHKVAAYQQAHPDAPVIRLGIGDVTRPLCPAVVSAMREAVAEMGEAATFRGYGPEQGYGFLRGAVGEYYRDRGIAVEDDPVYPVYVDTNLMAGRPIVYMEAGEDNGFLPLPAPAVKADIIYLCSPNNPTGAVYGRDGLRQWVEYALENEAVILFDAAYEAFISGADLPRSIYEIEGARRCAIEFCSFSKTAGFTGTRCGYTVVPMDLQSGGVRLRDMWLRRQTTKFNGVPYIVQKGAAAVFTPEGREQVQEGIGYYRENARVITEALRELGFWFTGGENSPYVWLKCPGDMGSWAFFDELLEKANVVGTPGAGFGRNGEGFFRLTAFGSQENTREAVRRLREIYGR